MSNIFNMFGPSPIKPIEQHMHFAHLCAKQLLPFFEAAFAEDWEKAEALRGQIIAYEKEADNIKKNIRQHLPSGLFLPVARSDLLELLTWQDSLADKAKDIAGLIIGRKMTLPSHLQTLFMPFLQRCIDASKKACKAINELDALLESGFHGNEVYIVEEMLDELEIIERDTDKQLTDIRQTIFVEEENFPPIHIVFLYQLVSWVGDIANHAKSIGGRLQILIAR
jgi:predicted phosphate transport protein (TIGR00153 family)